jgi:hypothetical protein
MMNETLFPFSKLRVHTVDEGVDCDGTSDFGLMLKLLDSQHHLQRSDLQSVPIQATESGFDIASKRWRDIHVATGDSQLHAHLQFEPGWIRSDGDQKKRFR